MNTTRKPLAEIKRRAIEILSRELGSADTIRFLNQFRNGSGDYTKEREAMIGPLTLDEILAEMKQSTG